VSGSYGFKGVVVKQQLIRLQDKDEIHANLPLSGQALVAQLGAELERGTTLDLATLLVGNLTGSRLSVFRDDLQGRCHGATHFVRRANVGAFVLQSGERAHAATAAALFTASAGAGTESSRVARIEDGNVESCKEANADSLNPPKNCGAIVRIHLLPISDGKGKQSAPTDPAPSNKAEAACPSGLVQRDGKCARPAAQEAHECQADNATECQTQCDRNQAASCAKLARLIAKGKVGDANPTAAARLFEKACLADQADACTDLGIQFVLGSGVANNASQALKLFEKACQLGDANGCFNQGNLYYDGQGVLRDRKKAFELFQQACNAGKPAGCINVGNMYDDGDGVPENATLAFGLFKKACEGDAAIGCTNLAYMYAEGKSVPKAQDQALALYEKACNLADAQGCAYAGARYTNGDGVPADPAKGRLLLKRACELGATEACSQ
jgi:TPR repeat protein